MRLTKKFLRVFSVALLMGVVTCGYAQRATVVGQWQTRDDKTHKPSSVIRIWQQEGKYFGKIYKIYTQTASAKREKCVHCKGTQYNKPMLGLIIIKNMVMNGDQFVGGTILDPRDGKEYHCILKPGVNGQQLNVRGYVGIPLFGQSKVWYRVASN